MTNLGKNEDVNETIWENEFNFWILHIKIWLYGNFDVNLETKKFYSFLGHFWLVEAKMKMEMKKYGKTSLIFKFFISKLGYMGLFIKIWEKNFWPVFKTFFTNWGKNQDEDEKIWKNEYDFWIIYIKSRLCGSFYENMRKDFLTHFLSHFWLIEAKMKMKMKKSGKMSSIIELSISKLG